MKLRFLAVALAMCLFIPSQAVAYANEKVSLPQEEILEEESTEESDINGDVTEDSLPQDEIFEEESTDKSDINGDVTEDSLPQDESLEEESTDKSDISEDVLTVPSEKPLLQGNILTEETDVLVSRDSTIPTMAEVYEAIIALKDTDEYKEGTVWTDDVPYSSSTGYYHWKGGPLDGKNISAVGCVAFAFILSDTAFGSLPARMYAEGKFTFEDIKIGDILRMNTDTHTVIVIEVSNVGVVVAEGNVSNGGDTGKIHWGRAISKDTVMRDTSHYITRYPEGYNPPGEGDSEADVSIANGTLNGGLTWNLTKAGTLTVSGTGNMPNFGSAEEQPWNENSSKIKKVVIADGVTSIGSCAFWNCGLLSAEISSSVTEIGSNAFYGSQIISVTIPSSAKTIGDSAFRECQNLSSVTVSEGVEKVFPNAFRACTSLETITLPASIEEVGEAAFFECTAMKNASFVPGNRQVKLGKNMFSRCYYLLGVTLPTSIDRVGAGMFQNCLMLAGVEIPQGAESIGEMAFASSGVNVVVIPDSVTTIGAAVFSDCPLTDIYFAGTETQWNSISKIGDTISAISKATIHYNSTPTTRPDPLPGDGDSSDNNTGSDSGNNTGTNIGNNIESNSGNGIESDSGNSAGSNNSGTAAAAEEEAWKPATPDEAKRYACMGREAVQCTFSKNNAYQIDIENAMQGPMCFKSFEAVLGDYTIGRTYNIYKQFDTIYGKEKEIQFTIKIPSDIYKEGREYKMICVTKGGQPIVYNDLDSDSETITIKTNKFHAYALIFK